MFKNMHQCFDTSSSKTYTLIFLIQTLKTAWITEDYLKHF
jgi:hypothetical protein